MKRFLFILLSLLWTHAAMAASRALVERAVAEDRTVYGVTTGFGALSNIRIPRHQAEQVQYALVQSHAAGMGPRRHVAISARHRSGRPRHAFAADSRDAAVVVDRRHLRHDIAGIRHHSGLGRRFLGRCRFGLGP